MTSRALGEDAIKLANAYMFDEPACLSPSQELRLRNGMATRADGKWAASRVGDFGGRQGAGKTDTILARILAGVMLLNEQLIIYTAHEHPTAHEILLRLCALFENWDDLGRELARDPRKGHTDPGFDLTKGRRILIKTRTGKSGRGFAKADLVIYDEAQHLQPEHTAGSAPAKLAHPNPQSWYAGSGGLATSVKAWEMRRQALTGAGGRLSYTEHTAQGVELADDGRIVLTDPDPEDRDTWAEANPGLGRWVTEEGMENLRDELTFLFPREGLCVWEPEPLSSAGIVDMTKWAALADYESTVAQSLSYGLSVAPDASWASFGSAGRRKDGLVHVDNVEMRPGTGWVAPRAVELFSRRRVPIRVNPAAADGALIKALTDAKVEIVEVDARSYQQACGALLLAVENGELRHIDQESLNRSVAAAGRREIGKEGAWVWEHPENGVDISPLTAATLALSGVAEQRKPRIHVYDPNWKKGGDS